jgi:glycosyltransferase involved in cell wall biosynthesis
MRHLIISREYPPAPYTPGGIGAYVENIARLLAERGETVHIIGQRWDGAPKACEITCGGKLIVHRVGEHDLPPCDDDNAAERLIRSIQGLRTTAFPSQWFAWHAALVAERLIEDNAIDVVEGQDWEAPLYFLLLRRMLGLGPRRTPPCIVHLHSPTEFIRHFNGALSVPPEYTIMKRLEDFCIRAADALLCPSHYLARQCSQHYNLPQDAIKVIHLPVGFTPLVEREPLTWDRGSICYIGRIEPRKGIIEWFEAAARIAGEDPAAHFDFIGADIWGLQRTLLDRLPHQWRSRFRFHGSKPREELIKYLAQAKAAVVPSRWENFPNSCIEAMSSGLPVITTRLGGMVELIEDGRTGWLAPETGVAGMVDGLAEALRRCLAASAEGRASMGRAAAEAVQRICDNTRTVGEQIAFRTAVAHHGGQRSLTLGGLSRSRSRLERGPQAVANPNDDANAGIIVSVNELVEAAPVLASIRDQTRRPKAIAVVCAIPPSGKDADQACRLMDDGVCILVHPDRTGADAWNAGLAASQPISGCTFWLFLDQYDSLLPDCLEQMGKVFALRPEAAIVSMWTDRTGSRPSLDAPPCPDLRYQLAGNDVALASAFRAEAIGRHSPFRPGMPREYDIWDLANRVIAAGWFAVTYPGILAQRHAETPKIPWPQSTAMRAIRADLLRGLDGALDPVTFDLIDDYVPIPLATARDAYSAGILHRRTVLRYMVTCLRHPRRASRAIARRFRALLHLSRRCQIRAARDPYSD